MSTRPLHGHKFTLFSSTTSTTQAQLRQQASITSRLLTRKRKSTTSRRAKVIHQRASKSQALVRLRKASQREKERPSQKAKVNGPLGHGRIRLGIRIRVIKRATKVKMEQEGSHVRCVQRPDIKLINASGSHPSSQHLRVPSGSTNSDTTT